MEKKQIWKLVILAGNAGHREKFISIKLENPLGKTEHVMTIYQDHWSAKNRDQVERDFEKIIGGLEKTYDCSPKEFYTPSKFKMYILDYNLNDVDPFTIKGKILKWIEPQIGILLEDLFGNEMKLIQGIGPRDPKEKDFLG